ncbi:MAG: glycoside hydrolase family 99-like domain-containing protein [Phycisphaerae bacterium]
MKKRTTLMVLVFAMTICCCNSFGIASTKKLMAHYMPWYQSLPVSGFWGWHWTMNHYSPPTTYASHYHPLFGPYDSSDPHVLASQALLMKFAGIDGMIADWYGIADFWDYGLIRDATNAFVPYIKAAGLEFSICYEDATVGNMLNNGYFVPATRAMAVAHGQQVMQWLQTNYFTDSSYLKIDDRPVLLCFGPQFFTDAEWTTLFSVLNPKPHFFPLKYHFISYPTRTGEFDWPSPQSGTTPSSPTSSTSIINNLNSFYSRAGTYHWEHYLAGAFPRFHDIYAEAGVGSSYGYIDDQYAAFGSTYSYTLERGLQSSADIVQLETWNDYGEGTIIEPTEEDGYIYLEITQQMRKQYIDADFSYTAADLRLPVRLYTSRKANLSNPTVMAQLATAENYLFADNLSGAEKILDQVECTTPFAGDLDGDCTVNIDDLRVLALAWLQNEPSADIAPTGGDGIVNFMDFAVLADNWLTSAP